MTILKTEIMERNMTAERFIGLLRDRIESESGRAIVLKMVASMSEDNAKALADECEDLVRFREYLLDVKVPSLRCSRT